MKKTFKTFALMLLAAVALSSCVDVPTPYELPTKSGTSGEGSGSGIDEGTLVTCAEAVALVNAMADGATSTETYTITGYITQIVGDVSKSQQTFWMADTKDGGRVFEAYWANLPEGVSAFAVGMKVKITGKLMKYVKDGNVTPEIKNATVVILDNGNSGTDVPSGEPKGSGTQADPYNAIAAIQYAQSLGSNVESTNDIYVTGIISSIRYTYSSSYGTATYNISVDGKAENEFTVYGSYYLNNQPWTDSDTQIQLGDVVVVCGKIVNYNGNTPEFANKKNWLVSITSGGTGGDGGQGGDGGGGELVTDLVNGDFESWEGDPELPTGWKSASSASNAELSKSTDARNGSYACIIKAPGTANKRLASQEITLEAGSYTFSFYAKSTTDSASQTRVGFVPIKDDGSVGTYTYKDAAGKDEYINLNNTDWTLVSYDFELTEETKVCLIVMNPKGSNYSVSQDILVDDATLVKN